MGAMDVHGAGEALKAQAEDALFAFCPRGIIGVMSTPAPLERPTPENAGAYRADAPQTGTKATHVVISGAEVFAQPSRGPEAVRHLIPGDQVNVAGIEGSWAKIARQGRVIGYVEQNRLLKLNP